MQFFALFAPFVAFLAFAPSAKAGEASAGVVSPLVDRQTLFVAHLDLMAFDAMETIDWLTELLELPDAERDRMQAQAVPINVIRQTLPRDASVDVYIVSSLTDIGRLPFFLVLPLSGRTPATAIAAEARRELEKAFDRKLQNERIGEAIVTGSPETIDRLKKNDPVERPEVGAAFEAVGEGALQIAFVPAAELRKLAETLVPRLPASLGGSESKVFTQGVVWIGASFALPPDDVAIHVVVQSPDVETATALERELARLVAAIGQLPPVKQALPDFDDLSKKLLPVASGDRLKLDLNDANGGLAALSTLAAPILRAIMDGGSAQQ